MCTEEFIRMMFTMNIILMNSSVHMLTYMETVDWIYVINALCQGGDTRIP